MCEVATGLSVFIAAVLNCLHHKDQRWSKGEIQEGALKCLYNLVADVLFLPPAH